MLSDCSLTKAGGGGGGGERVDTRFTAFSPMGHDGFLEHPMSSVT